MTNHKGSEFPCCGLFVLLQYHHRTTYFEYMESNNAHLPSSSQVSNRVWDRRSL